MSEDTSSTGRTEPELAADDPDAEETVHPDVEELLAPKEMTMGYRIGIYAVMLLIILLTIAMGLSSFLQLF